MTKHTRIKTRLRRKLKRYRSLISEGIMSLKYRGVKITLKKTLHTLGLRKFNDYRAWARAHAYTEEQLQEQRSHTFDKAITFSIITPLYNTPEQYLREMIESVIAQTYAGWELCLADGSDPEHGYVQRVCSEYIREDGRIRYKKLESNYGIAGNSNACLEMASGDYISLLDHDDLLQPAALYETMEAVCSRGADLIYTDEAIFRSPDPNDVTAIHFKPDFGFFSLLANNYFCHFTSFRRQLLESCGTFRDGFDGSQDHDLMLRLTEKAECIVHIPKVLYYWRAHADSTAKSEGNKPYASISGMKAVKEKLAREGISGSVELARGIPTIYRVRYTMPSPSPKISIIIPSRDHVKDLRKCITSIKEKTTCANYEIIIVENNSKDPAAFAYYDRLRSGSDNITVITWPGEGFNWSSLNNYAVRTAASGDYLLLLNNDTEVITPDWLEEMAAYLQFPSVGAVGAMLYHTDDTIQHAGVILGTGSAASHAFYNVDRENRGYIGRLCYAQNLSAVTGACMMLRRDVWEEAGGLDEAFAVNYNDLDLCMRIRKAGYQIVWTPWAELYHSENKTRGPLDRPESRKIWEHEAALFRKRWPEVFEKADPFYNPNFSDKNARFTLPD